MEHTRARHSEALAAEIAADGKLVGHFPRQSIAPSRVDMTGLP